MSGLQITLRNDPDRAAAAANDDMGDDQQMDDEQQQLNSSGKPRVVITTRHGAAAAASSSSSSAAAPKRTVQTKGRGFKSQFGNGQEDRYAGKGGEFESIDEAGAGNTDAQKSVEGWILIVTGLHEETNEDDLYELFADHGDIKQLHLNLDRRTGYVKGYALVEFGSFKEAEAAMRALNGHSLHEKIIAVDWAFKLPPNTHRGGSRSGGGGGAGSNRGPRVTGRGPRDSGRRD